MKVDAFVLAINLYFLVLCILVPYHKAVVDNILVPSFTAILSSKDTKIWFDCFSHLALNIFCRYFTYKLTFSKNKSTKGERERKGSWVVTFFFSFFDFFPGTLNYTYE